MQPAVEQAKGVRVRIFTTQEELPFAGHPTLGTAEVLKLVRRDRAGGHLDACAQRGSGAGALFAGRGLFGEMTQRDPEFGEELDPEEVARLTGLTPGGPGPTLAAADRFHRNGVRHRSVALVKQLRRGSR